MSRPASAGSRRTSGGLVAVAFEGGGFLAYADYFGLVAGLAHGTSSRGRRPRTLSLKRLFQRFDIVAGVSGGSWYASQLIYSSKIEQLTYTVAEDPSKAASAINSQYYARFLKPEGGATPEGTAIGLAKCLFEILGPNFPLTNLAALETNASLPAMSAAQISEVLEGKPPWYAQVLSAAIILIQTGAITWEELVTLMFEQGAGIDPKLPLGTTSANAWAEGKLFVQGVTAMTPSADATPFNIDPSLTNISIHAAKNGPEIAYATVAPSPAPAGDPGRATQTPAKYSVTVGAGEQQDAPLPFCATLDCFSLSLQYTYGPSNAMKSVSLADLYKTSFVSKGGMLPVSSTSAASSAFQGSNFLVKGLSAQQGCAAMSVWASAGVPGGKAFEAANKLRGILFGPVPVMRPLSREVARQGLQPLVDGGNTDATGVGQAVAAGAEEVLAVINVGRGSMEIGSFLSIFFGAGTPQNNIFATPTADEAEQAFKGFDSIQAAPDARFLQKVLYGSLDAVTTENLWFGVEKGRRVKLNVLAIQTDDITIGLLGNGFTFDSFFNFGTVSAEIVNALASRSNRHAVRNILLNFFGS